MAFGENDSSVLYPWGGEGALTLDYCTSNRYSKRTMNGTQTITISQLRQNAADTINSVIARQQPAIILQRSRPTAILVDIAYFQALEEAVLDATDTREAQLAKVEERTPFGRYIRKRWGTLDS